jgi:acetyltransferase-like isoleucine patch superfamily enzyme
VGKKPVEVYGARRDAFLRLIDAAARRYPSGASLRHSLFTGILPRAVDARVDVSGEVLFQGQIMQYYESNMRLASDPRDGLYHAAASRLPALAEKGAESRIGEKGSVERSWIASGATVEGSVAESVIFPNVFIGRGARVRRSVVLNGNRIGSGSEIHAALVLPCTAELPRPALTIGDNCVIGARSSATRNRDYPVQIRGGLAVIGVNAQIPGGFRAEAATLVPSGTSASNLRRLKVLRRGATAPTDSDVQAAGRARR